MFSPPTGPSSPKTNCVNCGAHSKWICQGCKQWYCQKCAPNGLCPTHFEMLDTEDREALAKVMTLLSTKMKMIPILMLFIIVPSIFVLVLLGIFISNTFYFLTIPIVVLGLVIPSLIFIYPVRKHLPRLKQMARKYNFVTPTNVKSYPSGPSPDRVPYSGPNQVTSLFTPKFFCFCFVLLIIGVGLVVGFILWPNS